MIYLNNNDYKLRYAIYKKKMHDSMLKLDLLNSEEILINKYI